MIIMIRITAFSPQRALEQNKTNMPSVDNNYILRVTIMEIFICMALLESEIRPPIPWEVRGMILKNISYSAPSVKNQQNSCDAMWGTENRILILKGEENHIVKTLYSNANKLRINILNKNLRKTLIDSDIWFSQGANFQKYYAYSNPMFWNSPTKTFSSVKRSWGIIIPSGEEATMIKGKPRIISR